MDSVLLRYLTKDTDFMGKIFLYCNLLKILQLVFTNNEQFKFSSEGLSCGDEQPGLIKDTCNTIFENEK